MNNGRIRSGNQNFPRLIVQGQWRHLHGTFHNNVQRDSEPSFKYPGMWAKIKKGSHDQTSAHPVTGKQRCYSTAMSREL